MFQSPSAIASAFYRPSLFQREDNRNYQGDLDDEEIDLEVNINILIVNNGY